MERAPHVGEDVRTAYSELDDTRLKAIGADPEKPLPPPRGMPEE